MKEALKDKTLGHRLRARGKQPSVHAMMAAWTEEIKAIHEALPPERPLDFVTLPFQYILQLELNSATGVEHHRKITFLSVDESC